MFLWFHSIRQADQGYYCPMQFLYNANNNKSLLILAFIMKPETGLQKEFSGHVYYFSIKVCLFVCLSLMTHQP